MQTPLRSEKTVRSADPTTRCLGTLPGPLDLHAFISLKEVRVLVGKAPAESPKTPPGLL